MSGSEPEYDVELTGELHFEIKLQDELRSFKQVSTSMLPCRVTLVGTKSELPLEEDRDELPEGVMGQEDLSDAVTALAAHGVESSSRLDEQLATLAACPGSKGASDAEPFVKRAKTCSGADGGDGVLEAQTGATQSRALAHSGASPSCISIEGSPRREAAPSKAVVNKPPPPPPPRRHSIVVPPRRPILLRPTRIPVPPPKGSTDPNADSVSKAVVMPKRRPGAAHSIAPQCPASASNDGVPPNPQDSLGIPKTP